MFFTVHTHSHTYSWQCTCFYLEEHELHIRSSYVLYSHFSRFAHFLFEIMTMFSLTLVISKVYKNIKYIFLCKAFTSNIAGWLIWLECGANNAQVADSIPVRAKGDRVHPTYPSHVPSFRPQSKYEAPCQVADVVKETNLGDDNQNYLSFSNYFF